MKFVFHIVESIIAGERENDTFFDELKGCRKGKNAPKPEIGYTGGVNGWFTTNGFIIKLKENIRRETPTEIIIDTFKLSTSTIHAIMFYQIMTLFGMSFYHTLEINIRQIEFCGFTVSQDGT